MKPRLTQYGERSINNRSRVSALVNATVQAFRGAFFLGTGTLAAYGTFVAEKSVGFLPVNSLPALVLALKEFDIYKIAATVAPIAIGVLAGAVATRIAIPTQD